MRTFFCECGNRLFFENVQCLACAREVGWCEGCGIVASFEPTAENLYVCNQCHQVLAKCINYSVEQVCNRFRLPTEEVAGLCMACQLTETIPDLAIEGNRQKWQRLEQAKRRLLYQLDLLDLPYRNVSPPLTFDFKESVVPPEGVYRKGELAEQVYTGHVDGKITINIQEADDVEREKLRIDMNEAHRTLIGHFRHEIGHYYWLLFVQARDEERCISLFGDHNNPDYASALAQYYRQGPALDWHAKYISAYASAHPWEDFAETFALYLDIRSVLDIAEHLKMPLPTVPRGSAFSEYVAAYQKLGIIVNELNRCMGILDLVPEVIVTPVVNKLEYIHELVNSAWPQNQEQLALTA